MDLFSNERVDQETLRKKAFNYRWATLEPDIIPLTAADPDFPVASVIVQALNEYSSDGYFSYAPPEGLVSFREAIAAYYSQQFNADTNSAFILPVNSAAHGLYIVAQTILESGDNVLIPNPVDFLFRKSIEAAGGEVRPCSVDPDTAAFDLEQLEQFVDARTKALFICNPNNPLGKSLAAAHLNALITFAERHGLWLVSDEIWADIAFDQPTVSLMDRQTKTFAKKIVVSGLSKNFGLAGLRIGYVVCPDEQTYATVYQASQHASTAFGISSLSQVAGTAALNHAGEWKRAFLMHLQRMRSLVADFCDQFPYFELSSLPDATYLVFPRLVNTALSPEEFVAKLQQEARVALVPGGKSWFESDSDHHVRICYATSEAILSEAFRRMLDWSAQNGV